MSETTPVYYFDGDGSILCPYCAEESKEDEIPHFRPVEAVLYNPTSILCDECGETIPGEDDGSVGLHGE